MPKSMRKPWGSDRLKGQVEKQIKEVFAKPEIDGNHNLESETSTHSGLYSAALAILVSRKILQDAHDLFLAVLWPGKKINVSLKTLDHDDEDLLRCYYPLEQVNIDRPVLKKSIQRNGTWSGELFIQNHAGSEQRAVLRFIPDAQGVLKTSIAEFEKALTEVRDAKERKKIKTNLTSFEHIWIC